MSLTRIQKGKGRQVDNDNLPPQPPTAATSAAAASASASTSTGTNAVYGTTGNGNGRSPAGMAVGAGGSITPTSSPSRKRTYDRFIPNREGIDLSTAFALHEAGSGSVSGYGSAAPGPSSLSRRKRPAASDLDAAEADRNYSTILRHELFGKSSLPAHSHPHPHSHFIDPVDPFISNSPSHSPRTPRKNNLFTFSSPDRSGREGGVGGARGLDSPTHERYNTSPVKRESQKVLSSPRRRKERFISKVPFKVLDAPDLADDFYLNLVDWSHSNILAVGLGPSVYLWNAESGAVSQLCQLGGGASDGAENVTCLGWAKQGSHLAVGNDSGSMQIYDSTTMQLLRTLPGHTSRISSLSWSSHVLSTGSRDKTIQHHDVRSRNSRIRTLHTYHKGEICGLRWSSDGGPQSGAQLASGGNDNRVYVWQGVDETPIWRLDGHEAAVKALDWNPNQRGLLATGGGTEDRTLRLWNALTGLIVNEVDTGAQICNLRWSINSNELISTHGFSVAGPSNAVTVWRNPSMQQVSSLYGHSMRVLYLAMSPDGQTVCTGAGDETLRFWHAFPKTRSTKTVDRGLSNPFVSLR